MRESRMWKALNARKPFMRVSRMWKALGARKPYSKSLRCAKALKAEEPKVAKPRVLESRLYEEFRKFADSEVAKKGMREMKFADSGNRNLGVAKIRVGEIREFREFGGFEKWKFGEWEK